MAFRGIHSLSQRLPATPKDLLLCADSVRRVYLIATNGMLVCIFPREVMLAGMSGVAGAGRTGHAACQFFNSGTISFRRTVPFISPKTLCLMTPRRSTMNVMGMETTPYRIETLLSGSSRIG